MNEWKGAFGYINYDRCAPKCDDQLPIFSQVGRGIPGDSYEVRITDPDTTNETYLSGWRFDQATKQWSKVWDSENINGGELFYYYNLRPFTNPKTFTMTWIYRRPNRPEWSRTTPAIPYIPNTDGDGEPGVDGLVGAGIANLFVREGVNAPWVQQYRTGGLTETPVTSDNGRYGQINWPVGTTPKDFNAVAPGEAYAATLTFGYGGDIEIPNLDDLAKILGWSRSDLERWLNDQQDAATNSNNVKHYIDKNVEDLQGQVDVIRNRVTSLETRVTNVENRVTQIEQNIVTLTAKYDKTLADIINKIFLGATINADGSITWPTTGKIPVGDLNIFAGTATPTNTTYANALRSRELAINNDIKAV